MNMVFRAVAYQKKPQDAGVDAKVAQTHAEAMEEFVVAELGTKDHLDTKLAELELRLIRWMIGSVGAAAVGIVVTLLVAVLRVGK